MLVLDKSFLFGKYEVTLNNLKSQIFILKIKFKYEKFIKKST